MLNASSLRSLAAILLLSFLAACSGTPSGVQPIGDFDVDRYMGRWYEVARFDHSFERGMEQVTATYTLRDGGRVDVVNRGYLPTKGEWKEARGKAKFVGDPRVGALKVSFFGPFYGAYNIVDLDADYRHALVVGPNRSYLWILCRDAHPAAAEVERLKRRAAALGFDTANIIDVRQ
jgi:apolipoprotein D and lipocalin family protein